MFGGDAGKESLYLEHLEEMKDNYVKRILNRTNKREKMEVSTKLKKLMRLVY